LKTSDADRTFCEARANHRRRPSKIVPIIIYSFSLIIALLCCSCSVLGLKSHITKMEQYGSVVIQVSPPPDHIVPTYALAWTPTETGELQSAGFQRLRADGFAAFSLQTNQTYSVGVFTDENGNGKFDVGEPAGIVTNVTANALGDPLAYSKILHISPTRKHNLPLGTVIEIPNTNDTLGMVLEMAVGDVVPLADPRFAMETGSGGLWRPFDFLNQNTMGIYFTEPYDPKRIPVIFVYGIGGSPQDWSYIFEHLDRTRYQLWFYHYPSGLRLSRAAHALAMGLNILHEREGFAACDVVAHSMGGLVAGKAIQDIATMDATNFIPKFISISTPWGGHKAASMGIRYFKKPVPSWIDVAPKSDFLKSIYANRFPLGTQYYLIYGEIPSAPSVEGEDDGVVTVESELDPHIRKRALSISHLPYGHVEILSQPTTVKQILELLEP
jgi:pimeloyl-ACP methyl ester carboxylesterase